MGAPGQIFRIVSGTSAALPAGAELVVVAEQDECRDVDRRHDVGDVGLGEGGAVATNGLLHQQVLS